MNTVPDIINNVASADGIITKDHITKNMAKFDGAPSGERPMNEDGDPEDLEIQNDPIAPVGLTGDI
jgi:hypothetical protein